MPMTTKYVPPSTRIVVEDIDLIKDVYTGKPGCCCGCRGEYHTDAKTIRSHISRTNALLSSDQVTDIVFTDGSGIFVETYTRYRNIYIKRDIAMIVQCGDTYVIRRKP